MVDIKDIMIVYYIVAFKMMVVLFVIVKCHVKRKGLKNGVDKYK